MGRLILLILVALTIWMLWKAFGPSSWNRRNSNIAGHPASQQPRREIKGPDDDEEFLWNLEKQRFKERRAKEEALKKEELRKEAERLRKERRSSENPENPEHP